MKSLLLICMSLLVCHASYTQTQDRGMQEIKVIFKFPVKGTDDAKTKTLRVSSANESGANLLVWDKKQIQIVLKNGKKYIFNETNNPAELNLTESSGTNAVSGGNPNTTVKPAIVGVYSSGDGTSGVFRLPKIESNVVIKDVFLQLQLFKKGIIVTDTDGSKKYFKLTNADSFDEADAIFG